INNTEVYADFLPRDGAFSTGDLRLTTTAAPTPGDNAYLVRLGVIPGTSTLLASWYDFHFNDAVSDVFLKRSDASGVFDTSETMASMQLTDATARGNTPA